MSQKPFQREPDSVRLAFHGMNVVLPPDRLPPGKYPYAQNVRSYLRDRVSGRTTLDSSAVTLPTTPHTIRRLNDSTPAGPAGGFILVSGASGNLYANAVQVDSGYSGNPLSLVSFRPNASVQPWMYVGDSVKMSKVRSDGTCYKDGIKEPQIAPAVAFVPASDVLSLLGPVTVYYFNNPPQSHSAPLESVYIWHNASDLSAAGGSTLVETAGQANGVSIGNSLMFDNGLTVGGANPVAWTQFATYAGTVNVSGTSVTWVGGNQFGGLVAGNQVIISGKTYTIAVSPAPTNTTLALTTSAGTQTAVNYSAAAISGTVALFAPALESEGYQDFNCAILATLYVPAAGAYTLTITAKDDFLWGIGNSATGTPSWPGLTGGETISSYAQTKTLISGYPLIGRTKESSGEDSNVSTASKVVTFSAAGNYPIEIDWNYWFHTPRGLTMQCNGANIGPIPVSAITNSQYRYTYRSSATGAVSNPSPESPETALSVLANNIAAIPSTDIQVDKIDFYRLDAGIENFTYVGTVSNSGGTSTITPVTVTGSPFVVFVVSIAPFSIGAQVIIDSGPNAEIVTIISFAYPTHFNLPGFSAIFTKTHLAGVQVLQLTTLFNDTLLDTDIAGNPLLEFDNFEPFPSIDLPANGLVNVDGTGLVTWVSGTRFNPRWLPGTIIVIGTIAYTLNTRPTSNVNLTATNVENITGVETTVLPPFQTNAPYSIAEPILAAQPLPYMWGPTDNVAFFFAVGDPLRPGTLYWTKGNNPDSAPDTNQQDVTSPSEPLINGVIVNGVGLVLSSERGFLIYPNFFNALATVNGTEGSTWTIQESISTRGLYMPRAICVDGGGNVFFRGKDGIYVSPGGQGAQSITDADLYNLFPHEGYAPQPVTRGPYTVYPPNDSFPQFQKMNVANGYLYYDYVDLTRTPRTLVYDIEAKGWVVDLYSISASVHVLEEGSGVNGTLVGCTDGTIRPLDQFGAEACTSILLMPSFTGGDVRAEKKFGDLYIEAEPETGEE